MFDWQAEKNSISYLGQAMFSIYIPMYSIQGWIIFVNKNYPGELYQFFSSKYLLNLVSQIF